MLTSKSLDPSNGTDLQGNLGSGFTQMAPRMQQTAPLQKRLNWNLCLFKKVTCDA